MDVVFGVGKRRTYEYDPVKSMVYLRVGTVEQAFARTVKTRDILREFVQEQQALLEAEQDEEKKAEIEEKVKAGTRQYQVVVAALQLIYGVIPQRNYQYNPQNSTLYLKISQNELDDLKQQIQDLQDKQEDGKAQGVAGRPGSQNCLPPTRGGWVAEQRNIIERRHTRLLARFYPVGADRSTRHQTTPTTVHLSQKTPKRRHFYFLSLNPGLASTDGAVDLRHPCPCPYIGFPPDGGVDSSTRDWFCQEIPHCRVRTYSYSTLYASSILSCRSYCHLCAASAPFTISN